MKTKSTERTVMRKAKKGGGVGGSKLDETNIRAEGEVETKTTKDRTYRKQLRTSQIHKTHIHTLAGQRIVNSW